MLGSLFIHGYGAVSAAGLEVATLAQALGGGEPLPAAEIPSTLGGNQVVFNGRAVDTTALRKELPRHPRLRRASNVTRFCTSAALQAIPLDRCEMIKANEWRLGIILTFMNGCVNYSCRFFDEVLEEPAHASPLIFPETVFNAPASHIAGHLNSTGPTYTLIGDPATWFSAMQTAHDWLVTDQVDGCLVVCGEELDHLTAQGLSLYAPGLVPTEGAAAVYFELEKGPIRLAELHGPFPYQTRSERLDALMLARKALGSGGLLVDGLTGNHRADRDEIAALADWTGERMSPGLILGEGMGLKSGLQTVAALHALENGADRATVLAGGVNQHAFSAVFSK